MGDGEEAPQGHLHVGRVGVVRGWVQGGGGHAVLGGRVCGQDAVRHEGGPAAGRELVQQSLLAQRAVG